jgi:hypothetical protein
VVTELSLPHWPEEFDPAHPCQPSRSPATTISFIELIL